MDENEIKDITSSALNNVFAPIMKHQTERVSFSIAQKGLDGENIEFSCNGFSPKTVASCFFEFRKALRKAIKMNKIEGVNKVD